MVLRFVTAALIAVTACAAGANPELQIPEVKSAATLDATFNMIEDGNGKVVMVSDNTRFVMKSFVLVDTWNENVTVTTPAQLRALQETIPLRMLPFEDILYFDVPETGLSKPDIIAYVDPHLESSRILIKEALAAKLTLRLIPVPFSSAESFDATRRLSCASQSSLHAEATRALVKGDYSGLPAKDCQSHDKLRASVITAQMIGAKGTPFVMAADGRYNRGVPANLREFAQLPLLRVGASK